MWWILSCVVGCAGAGGSAAGPDELSLGDPDAPPTLASLPTLPRAATGRTPRTRQGMLVAREGFEARLPEAPLDLSHSNLQHWVDTEVVAWVGERSKNLDTTRYEFGLVSDASAGESIVGNAVVGLLQEDTARQLATIPAPTELDSEPEIARMYREVIEAHARPFLSSALVGYRDCANTAHDGPEDMRHWAGYCDARFRRIKQELDDYQRSISGQPGAAEPPPPASGKTTVTVIAEPQ